MVTTTAEIIMVQYFMHLTYLTRDFYLSWLPLSSFTVNVTERVGGTPMTP